MKSRTKSAGNRAKKNWKFRRLKLKAAYVVFAILALVLMGSDQLALAIMCWAAMFISTLLFTIESLYLKTGSLVSLVMLLFTLWNGSSIFANAYVKHGIRVAPGPHYPPAVHIAANGDSILLSDGIIEELAGKNGELTFPEKDLAQAKRALRSDAGYFSLITLSTTGYGDIQPSFASRGFAEIEGVLGVICLGMWIPIAFKLVENYGEKSLSLENQAMHESLVKTFRSEGYSQQDAEEAVQRLESR